MTIQINEVPEIWTGSIFNSVTDIDPKNFESSRYEIVDSIQKWYVNYFEEIYNTTGSDPSRLQEFKLKDITPKLIEARDSNDDPVMDRYNNIIKYLEFIKIPITFEIENTKVRCVYAIRINICYENKSKIIVYLHPIDNLEYDSQTIFSFFQITKRKLESIIDIIGKKYKKESQSEDINYKINVYNIGTNNDIIKKHLNHSNIDNLVKNIKKYPEFERAYLDIVGVTHGHYFDTYENYLKNARFKHNWTINIDNEKNLFTLFAQRFANENNNRICDYSGLTNSANVQDIHSMDRRLVFSFINEF
jgi:hypothetical protein